MHQAVRDWVARLLVEAGRGEAAPALAAELAPRIEEALKASALDMLRQCGVAQFGETDDPDAVKEWTVSVNEAVAAAIRSVEHKRQTS